MKRADRLRAIESRIRRGDLDGAISEYRKVLETAPDDWPSVITLGDLQVQQGRADVSTDPAPVRPGRTRRGTGRPKRSRIASGTRSLQDVFDGLRAAALRDDAVDQAQRRFDEAQAHLRDGNEDAAVPGLEAAAAAPMLRFVACAQLGRLHVGRGELSKGIAWLERAAQAPPISPDEGHAVRYELADALERDGDRTRALVTLMELDAERARYRDVRTRIEALSRAFDGQGDEA